MFFPNSLHTIYSGTNNCRYHTSHLISQSVFNSSVTPDTKGSRFISRQGSVKLIVQGRPFSGPIVRSNGMNNNNIRTCDVGPQAPSGCDFVYEDSSECESADPVIFWGCSNDCCTGSQRSIPRIFFKKMLIVPLFATFSQTLSVRR